MDEENEAENAEAEGEEGAGGRSKKMLIIILAAVVVLLLGGVTATGFIMGWFGGNSEDDMAASAPAKPHFFYDLPEMVVNLSASEQRAQYLKVTIALELADERLVQAIDPVLPRVMDAFQTYLRELRVSDLQGSAGMFRLKQELQRRVNLAVHPAKVEAVLFREIIIQ